MTHRPTHTQKGLESHRDLSYLSVPFARLSPEKALFHAGVGRGRLHRAKGLAELGISITPPPPALPHLASPAFTIPFVVLTNTVWEISC